jgi:transcriptional regulator with XRE-family HTH domain
VDVETSLPRETGSRVRTTRRRHKLSRRRVAADAGFSARELTSIERGRRTLTVVDLRSLAGSIGVDVAELLPVGYVVDDGPPPDEVRIEDFLTAATDSSAPTEAFDIGPLGRGDAAPVERRQLPTASARLAQAFSALRAHTDELVEHCASVPTAHATDDVASLLTELRRALDRLDHDSAFTECLARFEEAREVYLHATRESSRQSWRARAVSPATGRP